MTDLNELSKKVYGSELVQGPHGLEPGPDALALLDETIEFAHPSGGARVDQEPEGDPDILLDYEALEDYRPTAKSIIADLRHANQELGLGVEDIIAKAERYARKHKGFEFPWEDELVTHLVENGWIVYVSDTRLSARRFDPDVHAYVANKARREE